MLGKRSASDAFNPINQYQAPKAPTILSRGKSGRVIENCRLGTVHRENSPNSFKNAQLRLGKGLPAMVSTQSINARLQKHQQYSPGERAAVLSKTADSELSTAKIAATRSKKLGSDWEKDCQ